MNKILRIIIIFLVLYLIFGIVAKVYNSGATGPPNKILPQVLFWPLLLLFVVTFQIGIIGILAGLITLLVLIILIWLSIVIDKKIFSNYN